MPFKLSDWRHGLNDHESTLKPSISWECLRGKGSSRRSVGEPTIAMMSKTNPRTVALFVPGEESRK